MDTFDYPKTLQVAGGWREGRRRNGRRESQISAPHPARPHDELTGLGHAQHAGRSEEHRLGRPECVRRLYKERWTKRRMEHLMRSGKTSVRPRRGFTLIELMIVMAIIVILIVGGDSVLSEIDYARQRDRAAQQSLRDAHRHRRIFVRQAESPAETAGSGIGRLPARRSERSDHRQQRLEDHHGRRQPKRQFHRAGYIRRAQRIAKTSLEGTPYSDW